MFLDQDAVPTLVEVKRSSDTRIRREVVGQMLDYAANAVAFWPAERLQAEFEATVSRAGGEPSTVLREVPAGRDGSGGVLESREDQSPGWPPQDGLRGR
ncbi:MAG: hypothetical protein IPP20_11280 [Gemmatimonadetes bacterium]|nr:hypothetical protein [Gemmatimonadota bacterium]